MITQYTIPVQNCQLHSAERAVIIEKNVNRKGETDHETCSADCRDSGYLRLRPLLHHGGAVDFNKVGVVWLRLAHRGRDRINW